MADLNSKDWGRIYAYIWLQDYIGNSQYKILLETDPVQAIDKIVQALNKEYPDLKIEYTPGNDAVWDIEPPANFFPEIEPERRKKLEEYRKGRDGGGKSAKLLIRFSC